MVSVLVSSAVDRGFEPRSGQTKDCEIGICCFSAKHAALRSKNKDWLARNQNKKPAKRPVLDIHQDIYDVLFTGVNAGAASCSICQFWFFYFQCLL